MTKEEWRKHPANALNKPKLSPEDAKRIADEAIAGGNKWDVQEKINARRQAVECGGGLESISAPAKFDAYIPKARCQAGEGAFGTYFIHTTEKYGVKLFRDPDVDPNWEFERMDKARHYGVNAPDPLSMNAATDQYGDVRVQTMVLSHMKGYRTMESAYRGSNGDMGDAPNIIGVKTLREFRKLHTAGLAHGDIHHGNIMVNERSKKVALIDFGYATELDDMRHPIHDRDGLQNLRYDLIRLPDFVGFDQRGIDFVKRHRGVLDNIEKQANDRNWEGFELGIKRYHDALEREYLWEDRKPRSRFISGADQARIPGLTRRIVTANLAPAIRENLAPLPLNRFKSNALELGVKPERLWRALKPERVALKAKARAKPFGTNLFPVGTPRRPKAIRVKPTPTGLIRFKPGTPTGMRRVKPGVDEFVGTGTS